MKLLEIKNNLAKISYTESEKLALADFVAIVDNNNSYVGQIINLKADVASNYAVIRLTFIFNESGVVDNYDGTIPSTKANLSKLDSQQIINLLPIETPVKLGYLAHKSTTLQIDATIFEKNLVICAEKFDNVETIVENLTAQLSKQNERIVVIDTDHTFGEYKPVRFRRDFKLPLNAEMIDYIYENDLQEVDATSKAVIQDIFYEVREYTKTVPDKFIPFTSFLNVVSSQYEETLIPELALLKSKLLKYGEDNIFAETKEDITGLKEKIENNSLTYIDIAEVPDSMQRTLISYIHNVVDSMNEYIYIFVKLTNNNGDKKLLRQIIDNEHIFTTIICSHSYKYLPELKQRAENLILFAPQTLQHDFASYNTILNKLNPNEFIVYGALTQNVPLVVELSKLENEESEDKLANNLLQQTEETEIKEETKDISEDENKQYTEDSDTIEFTQENNDYEIGTEEFDFEPNNDDFNNIPSDETTFETNAESGNKNEDEQTQEEDFLVDEIAKDVDEVFYKSPEPMPTIDDITNQDKLTEDDLDFIDDIANNQQNQQENLDADEIEIINEPEDKTEDFDTEPLDAITDTTQNFEPSMEPTDGDEKNGEENIETTEEAVPIYTAEEPELEGTIQFEQGDTVTHPKYGRGVIEKLIKYGNKTLCSISFENVGRRLLDPAISEITKV